MSRIGSRRSAVRRLGRRSQANLRHLRAEQTGSALSISFVLRDGLTATALWAHHAGSGAWHRLAEIEPPAEGRQLVILDVSDVPLPVRRRRDPMTLAIELSELRADGRPRRIALRGAARTTVGPLRRVELVGPDAGRSAIPYLSPGGRVCIAFRRRRDPDGVVHVQRVAVKRGELRIRGRLNTRDGDLRTAHIVLKARRSPVRLHQVVPVRFDVDRSESGFGQRWYRFDVRIDCQALLRPPHLDDHIYDVRFRIRTAQNPRAFELPIDRNRLLTRYLTRPGWARNADRAVVITPFYGANLKQIAVKVSHFDPRIARYLRVMRRLRYVDRLLHVGRRTWLVGEQAFRAQDNGYWFFRYLREEHPEVQAYYVIASDSPDRDRVLPLGNVIEFGSRQHIRLTLRATKILTTHHPAHIYPLWTAEFDRDVRAARVFLQHGVAGTKWLANFYGRSGFNTDLVIASSEREKEYLVGDFGYDPDEVVVSGLPRYDSLFAEDIPTNRRQILVMPTWRNWLDRPVWYPGSEFHDRWSRFLSDPGLSELVEAHGLEIVLCLHPNAQMFREFFSDLPVRNVAHGDVDVQALLKQSAILVTDYSSVGFDFAFLNKPVIYFQFDRQRFLGRLGSHIELDEELPGPVFRSEDGVVDEIARRLAAGFAMEETYRQRAGRFIAHRDRHNCDRVYEAVTVARRRRRARKRIARSEIVSALQLVFRRGRFYVPAMRAMFATLVRLPADKRLVVFESGLGRQYADSPRYIYEELARQRPDLKKVWAYNGRLRAIDPGTHVVPRLSVRYFYYLARAKYWVNNQSFPNYLPRRKDGVFVQTWHGTPLKRMLHDLPVVPWRDVGSIDRATRGAQQWSVLVSPSSYVTERMRTAYRYQGPVLEVGYPRNDVLHAPDRYRLGARVRARLNLPKDKLVVLYAPTFRDRRHPGGRLSFTLPFDLDRLHDALGDDTVLLLRMHLLVSTVFKIPPHLRDFVQDVSHYPEVQELYLASDALVTDYSSVFFDFAQLRRPMIFYAHDLAAYRDRLRGFYLDYEDDVPGPVVTTEEALIDALTDLDAVVEKYAERLDGFLQRFAPRDDGHAAERVVKELFGFHS